jgi:hypothetical protein
VRLQGAGPREGETWTLVREDGERPKRTHRNKHNDS